MLIGRVHAQHDIQSAHEFQFYPQRQSPCNAGSIGIDSGPLFESLAFYLIGTKQKDMGVFSMRKMCDDLFCLSNA